MDYKPSFTFIDYIAVLKKNNSSVDEGNPFFIGSQDLETYSKILTSTNNVNYTLYNHKAMLIWKRICDLLIKNKIAYEIFKSRLSKPYRMRRRINNVNAHIYVEDYYYMKITSGKSANHIISDNDLYIHLFCHNTVKKNPIITLLVSKDSFWESNYKHAGSTYVPPFIRNFIVPGILKKEGLEYYIQETDALWDVENESTGEIKIEKIINSCAEYFREIADFEKNSGKIVLKESLHIKKIFGQINSRVTEKNYKTSTDANFFCDASLAVWCKTSTCGQRLIFAAEIVRKHNSRQVQFTIGIQRELGNIPVFQEIKDIADNVDDTVSKLVAALDILGNI